MKKSSLSLISLMIIIFGLFSQFAFADVKFLSPIEGTWGNKQMLVIDNSSDDDSDGNSDGEYFYSINGSDPEKVGFAYDGPVLLDITGKIELKVVHIFSDGSKEYGSVNYSVVPDSGKGKKYHEFISQFYDTGTYEYNIQGPLTIPEYLYYSLEVNPSTYIQGMELSISDSSVLSLTVPCSVYDEKTGKKWRFIIRSSPQVVSGIITKQNVPFYITDWNNITFTDPSLVYEIDSEIYGPEVSTVSVDRSCSHIISWQSEEDFLSDVPEVSEQFVLPQMPEVKYETKEDGSGVFYLEGDDSYMLGLLSEDSENFDLFSEICLDAFYGSKVSGTITLGVYADTVYQGKFKFDYCIDKSTPDTPVFNSSAKTFYSRNPVTVNVKGDSDADLYVAVSNPFVLKNPNVIYKQEDPIFNNVVVTDFEPVNGCEKEITLDSIEDKVVYYKVLAFNKKDSIKGPVSEYGVIVDHSGYYFDRNSKSSLAEGTLINPFTNFQQFVDAIKDADSVSLKVKGDLYINKKYEISSDLEINNDKNGRIIFGPEGSLEINDSKLEISDCRLHKISSTSVNLIVPFIKLNNSSFVMKDCQIAAGFSRNGTIIDSYNSNVIVEDSIASISADSYVSFISAIKSDVTINNSFITITADTGVIISSSRGNSSINNNSFKIIGNTGRIAELFGDTASFIGNNFKVDIFSSSNSLDLIFADRNTVLTEEGNSSSGF